VFGLRDRGSALQTLGHHAEALALYDEFATHFPWDASTKFNRAICLAALDRKVEAMQLYRELAAGREHGAMVNGAYLLVKLGDLDETLRFAQGAVGVEQNDPLSWKAVGYVLFARGEYRDAAIVYERAAAMSPEDPNLLHDVGLAHQAAGDVTVAAYAWNKYLSIAALDDPHREYVEKWLMNRKH
jgi:tetratricopeptide (TPR) repeat protein